MQKLPHSSGCNHFENLTENVHVGFEVHIEQKLTINRSESFFLYISETVGRNFASKVHTVMQQVFIRNVSLRFYAKSKFCVCFEVHIPVSDKENPYIEINLQTGRVRKIFENGEHKSAPEHTFIWRLV